MEWLQKTALLLPNWAWIAIAAVVVVLVIVIIAIAVSGRKRKKKAQRGEKKAEGSVANDVAYTAVQEPEKHEVISGFYEPDHGYGETTAYAHDGNRNVYSAAEDEKSDGGAEENGVYEVSVKVEEEQVNTAPARKKTAEKKPAAKKTTAKKEEPAKATKTATKPAAKSEAKKEEAKPAAKKPAAKKEEPAKTAAKPATKQAAKSEVKKEEAKPAAKKPAAKKEEPAKATKAATKPVAKTEAKKETAKPVAKPAVKNPAKDDSDEEKKDRVYHISKRKEDGMWQIKASGGAKAIKLFRTQAEAIEAAVTLAQNQDGRVVVHKANGSFKSVSLTNYKQS